MTHSKIYSQHPVEEYGPNEHSKHFGIFLPVHRFIVESTMHSQLQSIDLVGTTLKWMLESWTPHKLVKARSFAVWKILVSA